MSAAERMIVRTPSGGYKTLPRRRAVGLISAGRAKAARVAPPAPVSRGVTPPPARPAGQGARRVPGEAAAVDTGVATGANETLPEIGEDTPLYDGMNTEVLAGWPIEHPEPEPVEPAELPEPRGNASRKVWATYAMSRDIEVTSSMTRTEIQAAVRDADAEAEADDGDTEDVAADVEDDVEDETDRLPQPAHTVGGRLETPEDEPATERVADDEDPGT